MSSIEYQMTEAWDLNPTGRTCRTDRPDGCLRCPDHAGRRRQPDGDSGSRSVRLVIEYEPPYTLNDKLPRPYIATERLDFVDGPAHAARSQTPDCHIPDQSHGFRPFMTQNPPVLSITEICANPASQKNRVTSSTVRYSANRKNLPFVGSC